MNCRSPLYLMSPPRRDWSLRGRANFKSRTASAVDAERARREWADLADAIVDAGGEVVVMPGPRAELTGLIYTAEAGELYRDAEGHPRFLLPNMAAEHRRAEAEPIGEFVEEVLAIPTDTVDAVWEAQGDAIRMADADHIVHTWGTGPDGRTEKAAYDEVAHRLSAHHIQIAFVADPWFHGNTFLQCFRHRDQSVVLVCPEALADGAYDRLRRFVGDAASFVELSREQSRGYDTNALQVRDRVIAPRSFSEPARRAVTELGLDVQCLDLGELFSKGGGAPVCLTNRLWGLGADEVPGQVLWSHHPEITHHSLDSGSN